MLHYLGFSRGIDTMECIYFKRDLLSWLTQNVGFSNNVWLDTGEAVNTVISESMCLDTSVVPICHRRPDRFLKSCKPSGHGGRPKQLNSDANKRCQQC